MYTSAGITATYSVLEMLLMQTESKSNWKQAYIVYSVKAPKLIFAQWLILENFIFNLMETNIKEHRKKKKSCKVGN